MWRGRFQVTHGHRRQSYMVYRHTPCVLQCHPDACLPLAASMTSRRIHTAFHLHVCTTPRQPQHPISTPSPARPRTPSPSVVPLPSTRTIQIQHTTAVRRGAAWPPAGATQQLPGSAAGSLACWQVASPPSRHVAERRLCRRPQQRGSASQRCRGARMSGCHRALVACPRPPSASRVLHSSSVVSCGVAGLRVAGRSATAGSASSVLRFQRREHRDDRRGQDERPGTAGQGAG
jgi:hypothetical protein